MRRRFVSAATCLLVCAWIPALQSHPAAAQVTVLCQSVSPPDPATGALIGSTRGGKFYAGIPQTVSVDTDTKVVIRVTGTGPLHINAIGPDQTPLDPSWTDPHTQGSSWSGVLPGDEWGTGWNFPIPGCWDMHVERGSVSGDVYFNVVVPTIRSLSLRIASGGKPTDSIRSGNRVRFIVEPEIAPHTDLKATGSILLQTQGKVAKILPLTTLPRDLDLLTAVTRLTATSTTVYTVTAKVTFQGETLTRDSHFQVVPAGR
jgi:hypothetical protein